jgi:excisionase family DNA binding protein
MIHDDPIATAIRAAESSYDPTADCAPIDGRRRIHRPPHPDPLTDPAVSYNPDEVGKLLGTSGRQIRKMIAAGRIRSFKMGRHHRVTREEILRFQRVGGAA